VSEAGEFVEVILLHRKLNEMDLYYFYSIKIIFIHLYIFILSKIYLCFPKYIYAFQKLKDKDI
jgi:hypothetical protein